MSGNTNGLDSIGDMGGRERNVAQPTSITENHPADFILPALIQAPCQTPRPRPNY